MPIRRSIIGRTPCQFQAEMRSDQDSAGFSADHASETSLAIYDGVPYAVCADGGSGHNATVMKYEATAGPCACGAMGPILVVPLACLATIGATDADCVTRESVGVDPSTSTGSPRGSE